MEEARDIFPVLMCALDVTEYVVFGHSVGGAMAVTIASMLPEQCKAIITESAQAFVESRTLEGI